MYTTFLRGQRVLRRNDLLRCGKEIGSRWELQSLNKSLLPGVKLTIYNPAADAVHRAGDSGSH
jgi:hypothetical protein